MTKVGAFAIIYSEGEEQTEPQEIKKMKNCENMHQEVCLLLAGIFFGIVTIVVELNFISMLQF